MPPCTNPVAALVLFSAPNSDILLRDEQMTDILCRTCLLTRSQTIISSIRVTLSMEIVYASFDQTFERTRDPLEIIGDCQKAPIGEISAGE